MVHKIEQDSNLSVPDDDICQSEVACGHKRGPMPAPHPLHFSSTFLLDTLSRALFLEHKRAESWGPLMLGQLNNSTEQTVLVTKLFWVTIVYFHLFHSLDKLKKNKRTKKNQKHEKHMLTVCKLIFVYLDWRNRFKAASVCVAHLAVTHRFL